VWNDRSHIDGFFATQETRARTATQMHRALIALLVPQIRASLGVGPSRTAATRSGHDLGQLLLPFDHAFGVDEAVGVTVVAARHQHCVFGRILLVDRL
jgi:hypothetical protein